MGELRAAAKRSSRVGLSTARSPRLQGALLRGDTTSLVSRSPSGDVHVQAGPGAQADPSPASVSRTALVRAGDHGHRPRHGLGVNNRSVVAPLREDGSGRGSSRRRACRSGPTARPRDYGAHIHSRGGAPWWPTLPGHPSATRSRRGGRAARSVLQDRELRLSPRAAHGSRRSSDSSRTGVLAALALPWFTALRARSGGGDWRRPVALVGDVAVAAHDPDALLPVILETALVATEADGGVVVWEGNEIASLGDTSTPRRVSLTSPWRRASRSRQVAPLPP